MRPAKKTGVSMESRNRFLLLRSALLTSVGGVAAGATPALAEVSQICSAWNVDRAIEVLTPAGETAVCEVRYRKPDEGAADAILWRASNSVAFCVEKAKELASRLMANWRSPTSHRPNRPYLIQRAVRPRRTSPMNGMTNPAPWLCRRPLPYRPAVFPISASPTGAIQNSTLPAMRTLRLRS
jgi:hypothetical protein